MTFAVDFDGTVVTHNYPEVGKMSELRLYLKNWLKNVLKNSRKQWKNKL